MMKFDDEVHAGKGILPRMFFHVKKDKMKDKTISVRSGTQYRRSSL